MTDDALARRRFVAIQAIRFAGVALVMTGLVVINRPSDIPVEAGYLLVLVGIADALLVPTLLARRWKSPPP